MPLLGVLPKQCWSKWGQISFSPFYRWEQGSTKQQVVGQTRTQPFSARGQLCPGSPAHMHWYDGSHCTETQPALRSCCDGGRL